MLRSRLGLKVLGLCVLVLGVMGLGAGGAQAEVGAHWNVINSSGQLIQIPGPNDLLPQLEIKEVENSTLAMLFETPSGVIGILLCTSIKFDQGGLLQANGGISLGRLLLRSCVTLLNGVISPPCKPKGGGASSGEILSERFTGLIVLDKLPNTEVDEFIKLTPENAAGGVSKLFVKVELGEECAIGEFVNIEAKSAGEGLWLQDRLGNFSFLEEKVEHLFAESLHGLIAFNRPATLDGSFWMRLAGAHLGLKWGGTPA